MHAALVKKLLHCVASMLAGLADLGGHRQTHDRGSDLVVRAAHRPARLCPVWLSCSACIRLVCYCRGSGAGEGTGCCQSGEGKEGETEEQERQAKGNSEWHLERRVQYQVPC